MANQLFVIIGDSNIRRNVNKTNKRSCPQLSTAKVVTCNDAAIFDEALIGVPDDTTVLLLSCVSNFLTAAPEDSLVSKRVEPVLEDFVLSLAGTER